MSGYGMSAFGSRPGRAKISALRLEADASATVASVAEERSPPLYFSASLSRNNAPDLQLKTPINLPECNILSRFTPFLAKAGLKGFGTELAAADRSTQRTDNFLGHALRGASNERRIACLKCSFMRPLAFSPPRLALEWPPH